MDELPMPSELRTTGAAQPPSLSEPIEPPSAKLIVRLFVIPLLIVAGAVGVMFLIGLLAGREPSFDEAMSRLRSAGGERTATYLVGPASKQRYLDAKALADRMKQGMTEAERVTIATQLIDIIDNRTSSNEGDVRHVLLLTLGRVWQAVPGDPTMESAEAQASRRSVVETLLKYADNSVLPTKKAAVLATAYLAGREEVRQAIPKLIAKLADGTEDIDVRIAAATVLGPLGTSSDQPIISALNRAMLDGDARNVELVWSSALSLASLNQPNVADTILKLLDRQELAELQFYDREQDPSSPKYRKFNDQEQQRILINTIIGARKLDVPSVQARIREISQSDPSPRVRAAAVQVLGGVANESQVP